MRRNTITAGSRFRPVDPPFFLKPEQTVEIKIFPNILIFVNRLIFHEKHQSQRHSQQPAIPYLALQEYYKWDQQLSKYNNRFLVKCKRTIGTLQDESLLFMLISTADNCCSGIFSIETIFPEHTSTNGRELTDSSISEYSGLQEWNDTRNRCVKINITPSMRSAEYSNPLSVLSRWCTCQNA
jgi:hypothetical protein